MQKIVAITTDGKNVFTMPGPVVGVVKQTPYAKAGEPVIVHCECDPILIMEHVKVERHPETHKVLSIIRTGNRFPLHKDDFYEDFTAAGSNP